MSNTVLKEFLENFEKELTCSICNEIFNNPKTLNCLHNYCYHCIEQWCETKAKARRLPTCPECRLIIDLPDGNATSLRSSFYLNSLLKLLQEMQSRNVEDHPRLECVSCEKASVVVAFCFQCNGVICEECVQAHKVVKQLKLQHEVVLLEQFKKENVEKYLKNQGFTLCKERFHERERLKFFCQNCKRSICQKCATLDHKDHAKINVEEANEQAIQLIEKDLDQVCQRMRKCNEELADSEENMDRIQRNIDSVKEEVTNTVESVIKNIRGHEAAILGTLNETCRKQRTAHHDEQNNIKDQLKFSSEFTAFARAIIGRQLGSEILDNQESISERCKELSKQATFLPEMKRNLTVEYVTNQEVVNSFQEIGKIVECVTDPECFSIESLREIRCGFVNEFEVVSKTCQKVCHATSELIGVKIKDCDLCDVPSELRIRDGKFLVKYKAEKAGLYEIYVTIGNQRVKNSPQIINTLDYNGELSPVKVFGKQGASKGEFGVPWSLAVGNNGEIAVVDSSKNCILIFDINGNFLRQFGEKWEVAGHLTAPCGIVFFKGDILVSDQPGDTGRIQEFDTNGTYLRCFYKPNGWCVPRGMCVVTDGGSVAVCSDGNERQGVMPRIEVLNEEGKLIHSFLSNGKHDCPVFITYHQSKYFVSYYLKSYVCVFDKNGDFLYQFGDVELNDMYVCGLAAYQQDNILVSDCSNHRVQIYTHEGHLVSSFGSYGSDVGQMRHPNDVAVSADGFVFVLECGGHRVQVWR